MIHGNPSKTPILPLLPLYLVIFIGFVGYSLMITVLTPLLMRAGTGFFPSDVSLGQRTMTLGILLALYPAGQFFGSPVLGALSDRFRRKTILTVSLCVTTFCYVAMAVALTQQNLSLLMLSSFIAGLAEANVAIAQGAIADVSTDTDRSRLFGYIYLSASSAYVVGPLVGGKLADSHLVAWFSSATPFWGVSGLLALTLFWIAVFFRETKSVKPTKHHSFLGAFINLGGLFTHRKIRRIYLANFLLYLAIFGFFRCYPMYLVDQFHMDVSRVSEFIAWVAVPVILVNLGLTGFLSRRFTLKQITMTSAFLTGIFMPVIIIPSSENALWFTLFLTTMALAVCLPACSALLSVMAEKTEQGSVMGNNQALTVGAQAISGVLGGWLAMSFIKLPLIVLAIIAIIAGLIVSLIEMKNVSQ